MDNRARTITVAEGQRWRRMSRGCWRVDDEGASRDTANT